MINLPPHRLPALAGWFPTAAPGPSALTEHALTTEAGRWWVDRVIQPRVIAVECGHHVLLRGDPQALRAKGLARFAAPPRSGGVDDPRRPPLPFQRGPRRGRTPRTDGSAAGRHRRTRHLPAAAPAPSGGARRSRHRTPRHSRRRTPRGRRTPRPRGRPRVRKHPEAAGRRGLTGTRPVGDADQVQPGRGDGAGRVTAGRLVPGGGRARRRDREQDDVYGGEQDARRAREPEPARGSGPVPGGDQAGRLGGGAASAAGRPPSCDARYRW